ncbi:MAG: hypothetical protein ACFWUA_05170 [Sporanaerobacter sp.]|jgi:hypothetical protein|uniref:hypothetical protein n=1 Tax=Sporanaerobacter sp. TaxID=2010183 RepID=UPI003A0FEF62
MKVLDAWLNKEVEKVLKDSKGYVRQQKINKVLISAGLVVVATITLKILNIF